MGIAAAVWLVCLGSLGASSLIVARKPNARELIAKLAPYQGWIGAISALWGVWILISAILNVGWLSAGLWPMVWWITYLATGAVCAGLGILLGLGVLKSFARSEAATVKLDEMAVRLAPRQGLLGVCALGLAFWGLTVQLAFL